MNVTMRWINDTQGRLIMEWTPTTERKANDTLPAANDNAAKTTAENFVFEQFLTLLEETLAIRSLQLPPGESDRIQPVRDTPAS